MIQAQSNKMTQLYVTVINAILSSVSVLIIEIGKSGLHFLFEEFLFKDEKKEIDDGVCVCGCVCVCVYFCLGGKSRGNSLENASYEDIRFLILACHSLRISKLMHTVENIILPIKCSKV